MKDTREINEQIELARQSGYNEACFVKEKEFLKKQDLFVKELKEELGEITKLNFIQIYDEIIEDTIDKLKTKHFGEELKKGVLKE